MVGRSDTYCLKLEIKGETNALESDGAFLAVFVVYIADASAFAAIIDSPISGEDYSTSSTIACNGGYTINATITVKLKKGIVVQDSASVQVDEGGSWVHDFSPDVNWDEGTYSVEVWDGTLKDSVSFDVVP
jgi:hypothetical protein